ncbi:MAG: type IV pilus modification protein PilV [Pseudomonas sp.]|uniref:type IV pilus modification protein PilV n=1 Tax=Pseudomonas sp. TaxID=306 RepID=UPI003399C6A5
MRQQTGFSLIEVLITLLLTTIGILGVVAMQGRSISFTQDSIQRNTAIILSDSLVEIMRSNPNEIFSNTVPRTPLSTKYKNASLFYKPLGGDFGPATGNCVALPKTAQEQRDCWVKAARDRLPGATALFNNSFYVCRSSARGVCDNQGSILEIQLAWTVKAGACPDVENRTPNDTTCIYRTRVEL